MFFWNERKDYKKLLIQMVIIFNKQFKFYINIFSFYMYDLNKGLCVKNNELRGTYVDPRLINYIAIWASPTYALKVGKIMDSINNKVHDVLEKQHLQDTVENAKPVFNEAVKRISLKIDIDLHNSRCWGVRDDVHKLDSYERDDLQRDIDKYNNIKKQLDEARNKLSEWNEFIPTYHPNFEY